MKQLTIPNDPREQKSNIIRLNNLVIILSNKTNFYGLNIINTLIKHNIYQKEILIKKKKIITHPANNEILKGITRTVLISLIKSLNLDLIERKFTIKELYNSDEVFITSSGSLITPIVQVDKIKINNCKIGSITKSLATNFYKAIF